VGRLRPAGEEGLQAAGGAAEVAGAELRQRRVVGRLLGPVDGRRLAVDGGGDRLEGLQPRIEVGVEVAVALLQRRDLVAQRLDLAAQVGDLLALRLDRVGELQLRAVGRLQPLEAGGQFDVLLAQAVLRLGDLGPQIEDRLARLVVAEQRVRRRGERAAHRQRRAEAQRERAGRPGPVSGHAVGAHL
jgi:hypothetical protein